MTTNAKGFTLWLTGLSGAGKSTISDALSAELTRRGLLFDVLDGDEIRTHLSKGLTFSREDRDTNIRRVGYVCSKITKYGGIAVAACISPYRAIRDENRELIGNFIEVYVKADVEECERRDVKGLYAKARAGEIKGFTGIDDPYEPPTDPEIVCNTAAETLEESVGKILRYLEDGGWIPRTQSAPTPTREVTA